MPAFRIPKPKIDFCPPIYFCKRAEKPFVLDGNIEKEFWADAEFTEEFLDIEGANMPKPRFSTRAKMLWDDENFYFGAILEGDEIWGSITERDSVIYHDNDFEIFIDPDSDTHKYYEFEMNALNTVWDLFLTKPYRDSGSPIDGWDIHGLRSAVKIEGELNNPVAQNKRWMVEIVMPFSALKEAAKENRAPVTGEFWRVNFSRVQWKTETVENTYQKCSNPETGQPYPEDNWVWSPTGVINIHYPELWGFVFFTKQGETYEIPEDELLKWELRRLYYQEHEYYDLHGCFTNELDKLQHSGWTCSVNPQIEITSHSFEISVLSGDKQRIVRIFSDGLAEVGAAC